MDEKVISQILDRLAAQRISADRDLLAGIQANLKKNRALKPIMQRRAARLVASVVVALLAVVTTVYAARLLIRDPGLQENMVTPLNLSQTKGDVTVTLEWAYADANRIKLAYTVNSRSQDIVKNWVTQVTLTNREIPRDTQEFFGFASLVDIQQTPTHVYQAEASFDIDNLNNVAQMLNLRLRVMGNYRFDFSVPFNPGVRIEKQPDVEVGGIKANIEWAIITPSMTRAYICYETPDNKVWMADIVLAYDGQPVAREPEANVRRTRPDNGPGERWCSQQRFLTSYTRLPHELTLTITSLQTPPAYTEEDMRRAAEVFAQYGVKTEVVPSPLEPDEGYTLNWLSPIFDADQFSKIWQEAVAAMDDKVRTKKIEGPWILTVHLYPVHPLCD